MSEPTKVTTFTSETEGDKDWRETTHEHLSSVELGMTAKGEPQLKSVKVYGPTAQAAADEALAVFLLLRDEMGGTYDPSS